MHLSPRNEKIIRKSMSSPHGLVLCVGPTGSGKTTMLHSCLGYINTPKKKIWTAEDPVEITQTGLRQVQVHPKIGLDFSRAMKTFLRGDPDVIMVGEMRDMETASIALEASLTGHLVLSTLHTNSAPETITRLMDIGMSPLNFSDALVMIIAQRLVKTLCPKCKEGYNPTQDEFDILRGEYGEIFFPKLGIEYSKKLILYKPVGCDDCKNSGYSGRIALHELLEGNEKIRRLILKQATVEEIRETAMDTGMTTLKQDGIYKIFKGDCDLKQVLIVC
jgi:type II secretory ATPase GspE/PulE/Tfp pilus assembly ATPase PilB-like protein